MKLNLNKDLVRRRSEKNTCNQIFGQILSDVVTREPRQYGQRPHNFFLQQPSAVRPRMEGRINFPAQFPLQLDPWSGWDVVFKWFIIVVESIRKNMQQKNRLHETNKYMTIPQLWKFGHGRYIYVYRDEYVHIRIKSGKYEPRSMKTSHLPIINQSSDQSSDQAAKQPINQSTNQPIEQSTGPSINPTNKWSATNSSINLSIDQISAINTHLFHFGIRTYFAWLKIGRLTLNRLNRLILSAMLCLTEASLSVRATSSPSVGR